MSTNTVRFNTAQYENEMIGLDNRGPSTKLGANLYPYHAERQPAEGESWSSAGLAINQATAAKRADRGDDSQGDDDGNATCDPHTGGPPCN